MKKRIIAILSVVAIVAASLVGYSCTKDSEEVGLENGSIYGIVTVTGEPLKGMGVSLFSYKSLLLKTVTYDDGHYEFPDLKPGEYTITVEAEGYETFSTSVVVESGRQARADMQLKIVKTYMNVVTYEAVVTGNTALLKGNYTYSNGYRPDDFGFYYSTSTPVSNGTKVKSNENEYISSSSSYDFKVNISDLSPGTYYVQAYAKNYKGTAFGDIRTFSVSGDPYAKTLAATNITQSAATLNGEIVFAGDPAYTERGFVYSSTFSNPTIDDPASSTTKRIVSGTSNLFSANVDGLTENAVYHVRAYVTNVNSTVYGESVEFTPKDPNLNVIRIPSLGLMIQKYDLSSGATWDDANTLCHNSTVGGYTDWRLPTKGELWSLYDYGVSVNWDENLVGVFMLAGNNTDYWSSTAYNSGSYYFVYMNNGSCDYWGRSLDCRVRAVRNL